MEWRAAALVLVSAGVAVWQGPERAVLDERLNRRPAMPKATKLMPRKQQNEQRPRSKSRRRCSVLNASVVKSMADYA